MVWGGCVCGGVGVWVCVCVGVSLQEVHCGCISALLGCPHTDSHSNAYMWPKNPLE